MQKAGPPPRSPLRPPALGTRRAAVAVTVLFAVNGMLLGGFGGSLPSLREKLDLDATQIAIMLFAGGSPRSPRCRSAAGSPTPSVPGGWRSAVCRSSSSPRGARVCALEYGFAVVGGMLMGLGNGAMDVAMNALGVQVEQARRRPIMSFFHAFFSVGNFVGAGAVLAAGELAGLSGAAIVLPLMVTLAAVAAAVFVVLLRITPEAEPSHHSVDGVRTKIPRMAWLLGAMALAFGLSEGTAVDWSALHVTDVAQVDSTTGSLGLIAVSGFMVVIRLLGDRLVARFGRRNVVRFGGVCAALGYRRSPW